ncbi:SHOCT domain-containing protein [Luteimicrobium sp. DT211]|uniref:SHOCT domain-containing protein n=1 Tax=Luteimicrobium sp. DT211 TaxID=3393412 RepID=UPI003CF58EEA
MGLLGGMARTAVVAGTATAVSNRVSRRQARRWDTQEQAAPPQPEAPVAPPAPAAQDPTTAQLERLASLHASGVLSDEEFAAAKARLLGL